jgi:hypothetical protein
MKKLKTNYTIKTVMEELDQSGRRLRNSLKGHRAQLRSSLQTAQRIIVRFLESKTLYSQFMGVVQQEKKQSGGKRSGKFNLSLEVTARATGASSGAARKLASKRAGVLDYLRESVVEAKNTAAVIKKKGIEKLYSEWCKKQKGKKASQQANDARPPASSANGRTTTLAGHNDKRVVLPVWMKLSDRDQLLEPKCGTVLTVLVSRVSEDDGDIQVQRVVSGNRLSDGNDWEDED